MDELHDQLQGQAIHKLDESQTNVDDQMPLRQSSREYVMSWRGF